MELMLRLADIFPYGFYCLILVCFATGSVAKEKASAPPPSVETLHPKSVSDINKLPSRLSDEQIRQILFQQLEKSLPQANQPSQSTEYIEEEFGRLEKFHILFVQRLS